VAAFLARVRAGASEEWRGFKYAILCGMCMAQVATLITWKLSAGTLANVVLAIIGDSLGFYGCLAVVAYRREVPAGRYRVWRTATLVVKKYWLAELIDNWLRAGLLGLMALCFSNEFVVTLTGNTLADIAFFGIAVLSGETFTDWCMKAGRACYARRGYAFTPRFVGVGMAVACSAVLVLSLSNARVASWPSVTVLQVGGGYGMPAVRLYAGHTP
jgi:hypothetical protein